MPEEAAKRGFVLRCKFGDQLDVRLLPKSATKNPIVVFIGALELLDELQGQFVSFGRRTAHLLAGKCSFLTGERGEENLDLMRFRNVENEIVIFLRFAEKIS